MHAECFVDDMQPIDIEIQNGVRIGGARGCEQVGRLPLEGLAGHESGAGVVLRLDDARGALCQHLRDARLLGVEIRRARGIEQGKHAHDALRMVAYGACQDLVGRGHIARDLGDVIDHDGALLHLHPCHQVMLSTHQGLGRHRCPLRVMDTEMFLSGTHSAARAQPMRSSPVFKMTENSSVSLDTD